MKQKVIVKGHVHDGKRLKRTKQRGYFCAWITNMHVPGAIIEINGNCRWFELSEFKFVYDNKDEK